MDTIQAVPVLDKPISWQKWGRGGGGRAVSNGQDIEHTTFAQIPLPNYHKSYGQAPN